MTLPPPVPAAFGEVRRPLRPATRGVNGSVRADQDPGRPVACPRRKRPAR